MSSTLDWRRSSERLRVSTAPDRSSCFGSRTRAMGCALLCGALRIQNWGDTSVIRYGRDEARTLLVARGQVRQVLAVDRVLPGEPRDAVRPVYMEGGRPNLHEAGPPRRLRSVRPVAVFVANRGPCQVRRLLVDAMLPPRPPRGGAPARQRAPGVRADGRERGQDAVSVGPRPVRNGEARGIESEMPHLQGGVRCRASPIAEGDPSVGGSAVVDQHVGAVRPSTVP